MNSRIASYLREAITRAKDLARAEYPDDPQGRLAFEAGTLRGAIENAAAELESAARSAEERR